jgi:adenosylmethionine-8-amino-7-oxononanoate aminotransferase
MHVAKPALPVISTHGSTICLADGRRLIDGIASWWTACHGYNHPHIRDAVYRQLERMPHVMLGGLANEPAYRLAERLSRLLPGDLDHVFFSDSGSVAVEVAMKMAVQFWTNKGEHNRTKFVSFKGAYHGDTIAAMSLCDPLEGMHRHFGQLMPSNFCAALPTNGACSDQLREFVAQHRDEIAALVVEPIIQGAGGMLVHGANVLQELRRIADEFGILLIFDEIFTGFGRTGHMFACQAADVIPDIVTLSKALTGGTMALSATVARSFVFEAFLSDEYSKAFMHGPTFMGNALACAAANASLDLFESEPRLRQIAAIETRLRRDLMRCLELESVQDVRVCGAMGAVELKGDPDVDDLRQRFVEAGVWIRPFGNIVYLTPAFTIEAHELELLTSSIFGVLQACAAG